ncbi:MAG: DUF2029 domain-containing protein [Hyphomicrobiaceae bacterium]|nr:DUF2029 domain-containing protein [Hyphomicrobiaceae bacterium]
MIAGLGLALVLATAQAARAVDTTDLPGFVVASLVHGAVYVLAVVAIFRLRGSRARLAAILAVAIIVRGIALTPDPNLSTDAYRYVWDGRVQADGKSPYLYVPADPSLAHLRDEAIYPNINQKERAVTIYPPAAELLFRVAHWLGDSLQAIRVVMLALDLVTILALLAALSALRLPLDRIVIYAWHPLPIWEFGGHGHVDAALTAAIALGLLAAVRGRQSLAGVAFAAAALVKYFPVILLPALWRRRDWRLPAAFVVTAGLLYLPYVRDAGRNIIGFLGQHLDNEGYGAGWGFHPIWLLRDLAIADPSPTVYVACSLLILGGIALVALLRRGAGEIRFDLMLLLGAAFVFLTSPHYPWYFAFLVALMPFAPHPAAFAFTLLSPLLYLPRPPGGITWTEIYLAVYWLPFAMLSLGVLARLVGSSRQAQADAATER